MSDEPSEPDMDPEATASRMLQALGFENDEKWAHETNDEYHARMDNNFLKEEKEAQRLLRLAGDAFRGMSWWHYWFGNRTYHAHVELLVHAWNKLWPKVEHCRVVDQAVRDESKELLRAVYKEFGAPRTRCLRCNQTLLSRHFEGHRCKHVDNVADAHGLFMEVASVTFGRRR